MSSGILADFRSLSEKRGSGGNGRMSAGRWAKSDFSFARTSLMQSYYECAVLCRWLCVHASDMGRCRRRVIGTFEEEVPTSKSLGPGYLGVVGSAAIKGTKKVTRKRGSAAARGTLLYVVFKLPMYHNLEFSSQLIEKWSPALGV